MSAKDQNFSTGGSYGPVQQGRGKGGRKAILKRKPKGPMVSMVLPEPKGMKKNDVNVGVLVTEDYTTAWNRCKEQVETIAEQCRKMNRKFRDSDFDIENDSDYCLHLGCSASDRTTFTPAGAMRVTDLFKDPKFYIDGPSSSDIEQGEIQDCWFLSALATVACIKTDEEGEQAKEKSIIEKICVKQEEKVGVYGFLFFRDGRWVDVIIDDLLFVIHPSFYALTEAEQKRHKSDPEKYNESARRGGQALYFAKSRTENETWVPLIEKAYAKLHGTYASLSRGQTRDAMEDLTGGVCQSIPINDILDTDEFWKNLLLNVGKTRLLGCYLPSQDNQSESIVNGLIPFHAYSVVKAREFNGKRFVQIRNPWGKGEWTGRWSDGSKDWTPEWEGALKELEHTRDEDGLFIMEYDDFLQYWGTLESTKLFEADWRQATHWLSLGNINEHRPKSYGDVSWTIHFDEEKETEAIIILQQVDPRYFEECRGHLVYQFKFDIYKEGDSKPLMTSTIPSHWQRSHHVKLPLKKGDYVVHVQIECRQRSAPDKLKTDGCVCCRGSVRARTARYQAHSFAVNHMNDDYEIVLERSLLTLTGHDLIELEKKAIEARREEIKTKGTNHEQFWRNQEGSRTPRHFSSPIQSEELLPYDSDQSTSSRHRNNTNGSFYYEAPEDPEDSGVLEALEDTEDRSALIYGKQGHTKNNKRSPALHRDSICSGCKGPIQGTRFVCRHPKCFSMSLCENCHGSNGHDKTHRFLILEHPDEGNEYVWVETGDPEVNIPLVLGLRVLTQSDQAARIEGQLPWEKPIFRKYNRNSFSM